MWAKQKQSGFTIVELLIVIVVIGILAAITIVAYNGIQERARMARATSFATQLKRTHLNDAVLSSNFDACSGSSVPSTAGPDATVYGTLQWSNDTPSGTGCSINFTGTQRLYYDIRLSSTYYLKSIWVKMVNCAGSNNIISDGDTSSSSLVSTALYAPVQGSSCIVRSGHNNSWANVIDSASLSDGKWHHIAVEFSAEPAAATGVMKLFKDGIMISTNSSVAKPDAVDVMPTFIGSHKGGNMMNGILDDPFIVAK